MGKLALGDVPLGGLLAFIDVTHPKLLMPAEHAKPHSQTWITYGIILLTACIFLLDASARRGMAVPALYGVPVLVALRISRWWSPIAVAAICSTLLVVGYFVSVPGPPPELPVLNRGCAFILIWSAAAIAVQRKQSRDALQHAHDSLEERINRRMAELSAVNELLVQEIDERKRIEDELARSNRDLQDLAFVASHDLQAPLRRLQSYAQLLESRCQDQLDAESQKFVGTLRAESKHMQWLINDLLKAARVRTQGGSFLPVDCKAIVQQVLEHRQPDIEEHKAQVTCDTLPTILADESQMYQLFENLLSNALKYRGEAPPSIHFGVKEDETEWTFSVRDNGIGIDPKHAGAVFGMFRRLHSENEYSGTGIGLAICQRIVERHGGTIWVESEPEKGCTFYFVIPKEPPTNTA